MEAVSENTNPDFNDNVRSTETSTPKKRILDLFSGTEPSVHFDYIGNNKTTKMHAWTRSVGKIFAKHGYEVTTLDLEPKLQPDIVADILTWDYRTRTAFYDGIQKRGLSRPRFRPGILTLSHWVCRAPSSRSP
jgi:hypothetical protein